jgi:hypothetical protein
MIKNSSNVIYVQYSTCQPSDQTRMQYNTRSPSMNVAGKINHLKN